MKKLIKLLIMPVVLLCSAIMLVACTNSNQTYSITIRPENSAIITCDKTEAKKGETINIECQPQTGYKLNYYLVNGSKVEQNSFVMPSKNVEINAIITPIGYAINYHNVDGATNPNPSSFNIETNYTFASPSKPNHNFVGWYSNSELTTPIAGIDAGTVGVINVYAKWENWFNVEGNKLVSVVDNVKQLSVVTIPETVNGTKIEVIGKDCFANSLMETLVFTKNIVKVEADAFLDCSNLDVVKYNGELADWIKICFDESKTIKHLYSNPMVYADELWLNNQKLGSTINLTLDMTSFNSGVFAGMYNIYNVYYEGTLQDWLKVNFVNSHSNPNFFATNVYINGSKLTGEITISGVRAVAPAAFAHTNITKVTLAQDVVTIGEAAFNNCTQLTEINLNNVATIGSSAFSSCYELSKIGNMDKVVGKIGDYAFTSCKLDSIRISTFVTEIGDYAFASCRATQVLIGSRVEIIGQGAFANNYDDEITIPRWVKTIYSGAFDTSENLTTIIIEHDSRVIDYEEGEQPVFDLFFGCSNLESIIVDNADLAEQYKQAEGWSVYASKIKTE